MGIQNLRILTRKYSENVEVVDPQLKNNVELVEILSEFEKSWTLGKEHLMDPVKCNHLLQFSYAIETTSDKHKSFCEQVECREADIFISIPCLLILKSLEEEAAGKDICSRFFPPMLKTGEEANKKYALLREEYNRVKMKVCGTSVNGVTITTG